MTLLIKAEVFGGTHIREAVQDAKDLARTTGALVEIKFNGTRMLINEVTRVDDKVAEYDNERGNHQDFSNLERGT